ANVGLAATALLARRYGGDRLAAIVPCADHAATRLGAGDWRRWPAPECDAWQRWAPVVLALSRIERWSAAERRAAAHVIRLKGSRRESDFVRAFDAHAKLRSAIVRLVRKGDPDRK